MSTEVAVALVAGLFGLVPVTVQIATARAQRKDKTVRLNHLRAELEFLERLHTLHAQLGAANEDAQGQIKSMVSSSVIKLLNQYSTLPETARPAVAGGKPPSRQELSLLRRMFLLYSPNTVSGWILHTLFYVVGLILVTACLSFLFLTAIGDYASGDIAILVISLVIYGLPLLLIHRLARRNAAKLEKPDS